MGKRKPARSADECRTVRFVVYGQAEPTQRPRRAKGGQYYTPANKGFWVPSVKQVAGKAMGGQPLLTGPLKIELVFFFPPVASKKYQVWKDTAPDFDNIGKAVCDALQGIVYHNDSQIADARCPKLYGTPTRCVVEISELPPEQLSADLWRFERIK